jgi:hypothetical protein
MSAESVPLFPGLGEVMVERLEELRAAGATHEQIRDEIAWVTDMVREIREEHRRREGETT